VGYLDTSGDKGGAVHGSGVLGLVALPEFRVLEVSACSYSDNLIGIHCLMPSLPE
jgi:hypothetical protein